MWVVFYLSRQLPLPDPRQVRVAVGGVHPGGHLGQVLVEVEPGQVVLHEAPEVPGEVVVSEGGEKLIIGGKMSNEIKRMLTRL